MPTIIYVTKHVRELSTYVLQLALVFGLGNPNQRLRDRVRIKVRV